VCLCACVLSFVCIILRPACWCTWQPYVAQVDLRIVVLQRDAGEILHSTVSRGLRGPTTMATQPGILLDNAMVLGGQLALLDRKFFFCTCVLALPTCTRTRAYTLPPSQLRRPTPDGGELDHTCGVSTTTTVPL
jgi:hypothetical protein